MHSNFKFNDINDALPALSGALLDVGQENGSRNGTVKELTHVGTTLTQPWRREILLQDRKANIAAQIAETAWVLAGRNDIEFLSHYLPRAKDYSDDGQTWRAGYGPRIRKWGTVDQLQYVIDTLQNDPLSRQAVIGIWDPPVDTTPGLDRACNDLLMLTSRLGYLDLQVCVRSNDLIWGWSGVNVWEWSTLQEIVAGILGIRVGALHFSTSSLHLYQPHWDRARKIAAHSTSAPPPPTILESPRFNPAGIPLDSMLARWFELEERIRLGFDSDQYVAEFPEPMFQSWLRVLQWWWTGDHSHLKPLAGTRLEYATHVALQPPSRHQTELERRAAEARS